MLTSGGMNGEWAVRILLECFLVYRCSRVVGIKLEWIPDIILVE